MSEFRLPEDVNFEPGKFLLNVSLHDKAAFI